MELLYIYIQDDGRNIKDCEFNFSPQYRFHYDRERSTLMKKDLDSYVPNFWGANNIQNITAIIGKNGAGKSNLLDYIVRLLSGEVIRQNVICIYSNNQSYHIICKTTIPNIEDKCNCFFQGIEFVPSGISVNIYNSMCLYYSPNIDRIVPTQTPESKVRDISLGGSLKQIHSSSENCIISDLELYLISSTFTQLHILEHFHEEISKQYPKDLTLPKTLEIIFRLPMGEVCLKNTFEDSILYILANILRIGVDKKMQDEISSLVKKQLEISQSPAAPNIYDELCSLYKSKKIIFSNGGTEYHHKKFISLTKSDQLFTIRINRENISQNLFVSLFKLYFGSLPSFGEIENLCTNAVFGYPLNISAKYMDIHWTGMSSGEFSFFNLFCQLAKKLYPIKGEDIKYTYAESYSQSGNINNIVLILDEAEMSFHPEWQRKYLDSLISLLKSSFNAFSFQIIIASHSPIVVSDFPNNNIIFLNKNEYGTCKVEQAIGQDTFAANIHSLYKNAFFLCGAPMGEFAKNEIEGLFDRLRNSKELSEEQLSDIQSEIQLIGEPLLRNQLMKHYFDKCNIEERISVLEKELEQLKQSKNYD